MIPECLPTAFRETDGEFQRTADSVRSAARQGATNVPFENLWSFDPLETLRVVFYSVVAVSVVVFAGIAWRQRPKRITRREIHMEKPTLDLNRMKNESTPEPRRQVGSGNERSGRDNDLADDELNEESTPELKVVEFTPWAPASVPTSHRFQVRIDITRPKSEPGVVMKGESNLNLETLVTQIYQGSRIGLLFRSDRTNRQYVPIEGEPLTVYAPFQALNLTAEDLFVAFYLKSPRDGCCTMNTVLVTVNGTIIARLEVPIVVDPALKDDAGLEKRDPRSQSASFLARQIHHAKAKVRPIREAFICYEHHNWRYVSKACQPLEVAGVKCYVDCLDQQPTTDWEGEVDALLARVDLTIVFWSSSIMSRASTVKELEMLREMVGSREDLAKQLLVDVVFLDDSRDLVPHWLRTYLRQSKRWNAFEQHHASEEKDQRREEAYLIPSRRSSAS